MLTQRKLYRFRSELAFRGNQDSLSYDYVAVGGWLQRYTQIVEFILVLLYQ